LQRYYSLWLRYFPATYTIDKIILSLRNKPTEYCVATDNESWLTNRLIDIVKIEFILAVKKEFAATL